MTSYDPEMSQDTNNNQADFISKMRMHSQTTDTSVIDYERELIRAESEVVVDTIDYSDEGWDSRVYLVNRGQICYKFPRSPEVMPQYEQEAKALVHVAGLGSVMNTQRFKSLGSSNSYLSYYGLIGVQLSELLETMSERDKHEVGEKIGRFLRALHDSDLEDAQLVTVPDEVSEYQHKYRLAQPLIHSHFTVKQQRIICDFFYDRMPSDMLQLGEESRLCHGDLGTYNIIIDSEGEPGIIDFGNLGYYDHSKDFIDFGDNDLLDAVLEAYGDSDALRAKTAVRIMALPVIDLVYYTAKKDNQGIDATIARLHYSLDTMLQKDSQ